MTLFPVLVDVYHKEQLVTKEEAEKAASWKWSLGFWLRKVAIIKDASTATRIADIMEKYQLNSDAQHIRGKCVYICKHRYLCTIFKNLVEVMLGFYTEY